MEKRFEGNDKTRRDVNELIGRGRGCRLYCSTSQTIQSTANTPLAFDTEVIDDDDCWSSGEPTKLYARVSGYYAAGGGAVFVAGYGTGYRISISVRKNGSIYLQSPVSYKGTDANYGVCVSTEKFYLAAGGYVEICVYHDRGFPVVISAATVENEYLCNGWLVRIG
jgi:hypothetical protein